MTYRHNDAPVVLNWVQGSVTSLEAAESIQPRKAPLRDLVLKALEVMGERGATDAELQDWTGLNPSTERPRRIELVQAGLVRDSGRTRKTASGRKAVVWCLTGA